MVDKEGKGEEEGRYRENDFMVQKERDRGRIYLEFVSAATQRIGVNRKKEVFRLQFGRWWWWWWWS